MIRIIIAAVVLMISACNLSYRMTKTEWTVPEVKKWAADNQERSTWKGLILYQGSDTEYHHFIGRVMDEWRWFNIKRTELSLEDVRPYSNTSSGSLGYYYVDPLAGFVKVNEVTEKQDK